MYNYTCVAVPNKIEQSTYFPIQVKNVYAFIVTKFILFYKGHLILFIVLSCTIIMTL